MSATEISLEQVLGLARRLPPVDQARLVARLTPIMDYILPRVESVDAPLPHPLRGLLEDLGPAPSAEDIDAVREEMWPTLLPE